MIFQVGSGDCTGCRDWRGLEDALVHTGRSHPAMRTMLAQGDIHGLERSCRSRIAANSRDDEAHYYLGLALERLEARAAAIVSLNASLAISVSAERLGQLARMLVQARRDDEALDVARQAQVAGPETALDHDTIGCVLARLGHHAEALVSFDAACLLDPDNIQFQYNRACELHFTGSADAAEGHERVLALDPFFVRSHLALATIDVVEQRRERLERIERVLPAVGDTEARLKLHCAAARDAERLGERDQAFDHLNAGKSPWNRRIGYHSAQDDAMFDALIGAFDDADYFAGIGSSDPSPIFVIGMPRSGTTLVDRILSNHSSVISAGELQAMPMAAKAVATIPSRGLWDPVTIAGLARVSPRQLGDLYLKANTQYAVPGRRWIDKLPMNFLYAGHILRALPHARILCLRRDPMDVVWSNYKHLFAPQVPAFGYSYDPVDTARYVAQFERLMSYWHMRFPDRIHDVTYEGMVEDLDATVIAMLDFAGLPFEADCLRFFENTSPVATPSATQVRRPIYRSSVGAWRGFATQLQSARDELDRHGVGRVD